MKYLYSIILALFLTSCGGNQNWETENYSKCKIYHEACLSVRYTDSDFTIQLKNIAKMYRVAMRLEVTEGEKRYYVLIFIRGTEKQVKDATAAIQHLEWNFY